MAKTKGNKKVDQQRADRLKRLCGNKFGEWTVTGKEVVSKMIECTCSCPDKTVRMIHTGNLEFGKSFSCGCKKTAKFKKTSMEKYGVENPAQSKEVQEKTKATSVERYGHESHLFSAKSRQKIIDTNMARYGVENSGSNPVVRARMEATCMEKYGSKSSFGNKEVQAKARATWQEKYGVDHIGSHSDSHGKAMDTKAQNGWVSDFEQDVKDYIHSLGFETRSTWVGGKEARQIDIHVIGTDLYIECNGDYYHSEARDHIHKNYHKYKTDMVKSQKDGELIHIFESVWNEKNEQWKNVLSSRLGIGKTIYARKCDVVEIDQREAFEFCSKNHLQGRPGSTTLCLSLKYEGEIVGVATFSRPHRQNMGITPHLSRLCFAPGINIAGGLSRLSKHAFDRIGEFVTYVHLSLSSGGSYEKSGYVFDSKLPPDYWYWDLKNRKSVSKQSRRKSAVETPKGMTERDHAIQDNLYRIWDCGKLKFRYSGATKVVEVDNETI